MNSQQKKYCSIMCPVLLILPAIAFGVAAMINGGVSAMLWGQQIVAWIVFGLLAMLLKRAAGKVPATVWSVLLLIPMLLTLLGEGVGGAKRWLDLGVFNVNAAMLVLPALLVVMNRTKVPLVVSLLTALVLCLQPDLSQLAAFAAAVLPILWQREKKALWRASGVIALGAAVVWCVRVPVTLEPVSYCEGMLSMLGNISWVLKVEGCIALLAIPAFFLYGFGKQKKVYLLSLGIYYLVSMLFVLTGEYPVPFMGFGISPIAGFALACIYSSPDSIKD